MSGADPSLASARPAVLFLAHLLPWPLEGGGQIKSYHTLRLLSTVYDITLIAFIRKPEEIANVGPLEALCAGGVKTVLLPRGKVRDALHLLRALAARRSFLMARDGVAEMHTRVASELEARPYAALHVDHLQMMQFVPADTRGAKVVLDNHNIEYLIPKRMAETAKNPLLRLIAAREWPRLREFERNAIRRADITLAVSDEDATGLREMVASRTDCIHAIPIGVDTGYFAPAQRSPGTRTLLSIGTMYWPPNVEALLYFYQEILPLIQAKAPDVRLNIVGARPTAAIEALGKNDPAVTVTGSVPDVRPYAGDCAAFIVPLRAGSGMRVKILNALSMALPVVSTTVGAEGIEVTSGEHLLIADTPEEFAGAVLRLLKDPALGERLGLSGRRLMETRYSWEAVGRGLLQLYANSIIVSGPSRIEGENAR